MSTLALLALALLLALPLRRLLRRLAREYRDWRAFERACRDLRRS